MDAAEPVLLKLEEGVATLTLNRPAALNAISRALAADLLAALGDLAARPDLRVVILRGAGERAFCTGADLKERASLSAAERGSHTGLISAAADVLAALPVPTIPAIRGYALAGGLELALACDIRLAAADAIFGLTEVRIGIFPGAGGPVRLPRGGGPARGGSAGSARWGAPAAARPPCPTPWAARSPPRASPRSSPRTPPT